MPQQRTAANHAAGQRPAAGSDDAVTLARKLLGSPEAGRRPGPYFAGR
ncbi:hypothetical protein [Actinacidiphila oryziradicis]|nr:hypothetical protein [Actinacidiphila oryziradicis]